MKREPIQLVIPDTGRTDAILEEVTQAIESRRVMIEADPLMGTLTLLIRLDRGPRPRVIWRTESAPPH